MNRFETRDLHTKRMALWNASMDNHKRYLDESTGLFGDAFMERRNCPVCDADESLELFQKSGGIYCRCARCGMVFLNPVMRDEHLRDYYRGNHDVQSQIVKDDGDFYSALYNKGLDLAEAEIGAAGGDTPRSLLDIGCSAGGFLDIAARRGYRTTGLELNAEEAAVCRRGGHEVVETTLEELDGTRRFDLISLWDVYEHVKDGRSLLSKAREHLTEGGAVFIQSPTQDALAARILQERCNMFDGLEHVNLYSHANLEAMADRCGMKVARIQSVIPETGVIANHLDYQHPYLGASDGASLRLAGFDAETILGRNLGYKFQAVLIRRP